MSSMKNLLANVSRKLERFPALTMGLTFSLGMSVASFSGLIYTHGNVLGIFWLVAAGVQALSVALLTR